MHNRKKRFIARLVLVPTKSISVNWKKRYQHGDWDEEKAQALALSFIQHDILHPPIVRELEDGSLDLGPGGHRLKGFIINAEAARPCPNPAYKNWSVIPVRICRGLTDDEMAVLDLIENVQRRTLAWPARTHKIFDIHKHQIAQDPTWTYKQTADLLGLSIPSIGPAIRIWSFILSAQSEGDQKAADQAQQCPTDVSADQLISRRLERNRQADLDAFAQRNVLEIGIDPAEEPDKAVTKNSETEGLLIANNPKVATIESIPTCPIINIDFASFINTYSGPRFNLLHIDPPYGIDTDTNQQQGARKDWEHYADTEQDYWDMLSLFIEAADTIIAPSAHTIWWLPFKHYIRTVQILKERLVEWRIDPVPLIWFFSDSSGICPAPSISGRRNYEFALFLSRNQRPLVHSGNMAVAYPKGFAEKIHQSEKPKHVVSTFCRMLVDDHTIALDPTAGSGRPLQAITDLGSKQVVGLEKNQSIYDLAEQDWLRWERSKAQEKREGINTSNMFT